MTPPLNCLVDLLMTDAFNQSASSTGLVTVRGRGACLSPMIWDRTTRTGARSVGQACLAMPSRTSSMPLLHHPSSPRSLPLTMPRLPPLPFRQVVMPPLPSVAVEGLDLGPGGILINVTAGAVATLDASPSNCSLGACSAFAW